MNTYTQNQATSAPLPPLPDSPVFNTFAHAQKLVAELDAAVQMLRDKINPILRPEPVAMTSIGAKAGTNLAAESDLTEQLRNHANALESLLNKVNQMRECSEV